MRAIVAKWNGRIIAESDDTIVVEGNHYFPPDSIDETCFTESETSTHCPWKGDAAYKSIVVGDEVNEDACWYYPTPTHEASRIRGYYAFWRGVEIIKESAEGVKERLSDEFLSTLAELDHSSLTYTLPASFIHKLSFFNFHNSTTACFFTDHERIIHRVNPTFAWTFSEQGSVLGKSLRELLVSSGMDGDELEACLATLDSHGWVKVPQIQINKGEEVRYFSLDAVITRHGEMESLTGLQGQFIDITDEVVLRHTIEAQNEQLESLKSNLERLVVERTKELDDALGHLSAIIDNISDSILVADAHDGVKLTNPSLVEIFGVGAAVTGKHVSESFPPELVELITGRSAGEISLPGDRVGKAVVDAITSEDGTPLGSVTVIRDITLEKGVDRMKTDFIANVSHELRTPLTSILGFAHIVEKRLKTLFPLIESKEPRVEKNKEQVRTNIGIIVSEGERLTRIINDVLDIAKIEAGKMEWKMEPASIGSIVERATAATSVLFEETPVELKVVVQPNLPEVIVDEERIIQVVINLVSNAAKFTPRGSVICTARRSDEGVLVSVSDTGVGIPREHRELVFEKFRQVGNTLTDKPLGTGLGLPLCQRVVEHHGGNIWVDSEVGVGSTFSFTIPYDGTAAPSVHPGALTDGALLRHLAQILPTRASDAGDGTQASPSTRTVLVVDDDPSIRELLRQELGTRGHEVVEAVDGVEAIAMVKASPPDLIVLDIMMPTMNGYDVAAVLKADPATRSIPIVIYSVMEDDERGLRLGVDLYFRKSTDTEELIGAVDALLRRGRSRKQVLVVDEDESTLESLSRVLGARGYTVTGVTDGDALIERAREVRPDVVIVDALFPDARDVIRSLRFENELGDILIVILGQNGQPVEAD